VDLVDANIIIRIATGNMQPEYAGAFDLFREMAKGEKAILIETPTLFEVDYVLEKFYKQPKSEVVSFLRDLMNFPGIINSEKHRIFKTLLIYEKNNLDIQDCYLLSALENPDVHYIFTYDKKMISFNPKKVKNP